MRQYQIDGITYFEESGAIVGIIVEAET